MTYKIGMQLSERELLEMAAKAVGKTYADPMSWEDGAGWDPLDDDGDALRLAVELQLDILQDSLSITVKKWCSVNAEVIEMACVQIDGDRLSTTRRAIVRAAAAIAIGKVMP